MRGRAERARARPAGGHARAARTFPLLSSPSLLASSPLPSPTVRALTACHRLSAPTFYSHQARAGCASTLSTWARRRAARRRCRRARRRRRGSCASATSSRRSTSARAARRRCLYCVGSSVHTFHAYSGTLEHSITPSVHIFHSQATLPTKARGASRACALGLCGGSQSVRGHALFRSNGVLLSPTMLIGLANWRIHMHLYPTHRRRCCRVHPPACTR